MFPRLSLFTLVSTLGAIGASAQSCTGTPYTVVSGDSCITIASKINSTVVGLELCNPQIDSFCSNLAPGELLATPANSCSNCVTAYTVQPNDICTVISSRFDVSLAQLLCANPKINAECTNLLIGEILCIPPASATT
ncbi:hypothetical protein GYMLUDRAFT_43424 [Collybiopsis luxurians FD-317 M1]|uniref:LysM domain-containing protein n=1 Tax=Collybiopsis luxurians FD-317 M1 TaxID=944289 RepID=A0A0D0BAR6_9AGAR|nr:hypothetical protein GYMLUDRAFT_43424 [Collybiopsis luxurians FD-317 M1]